MTDQRAQAYAQQAAAESDRSDAGAQGQRIGGTLRRGVDSLVPDGLVRRVVVGTCTAVDSAAGTATFAVGDWLPDGQLAGVVWGLPWRAPVVGEALPIFLWEATA